MIIKIDGQENLNKILREMPKKAENATENELKIVALDLQGKAQNLAPVDTGDLRGSAFNDVKGMTATIGFNEPYAMKQHEDVELRHPKGGQSKYLETPYKENISSYIRGIAKAVKGAID